MRKRRFILAATFGACAVACTRDKKKGDSSARAGASAASPTAAAAPTAPPPPPGVVSGSDPTYGAFTAVVDRFGYLRVTYTTGNPPIPTYVAYFGREPDRSRKAWGRIQGTSVQWLEPSTGGTSTLASDGGLVEMPAFLPSLLPPPTSPNSPGYQPQGSGIMPTTSTAQTWSTDPGADNSQLLPSDIRMAMGEDRGGTYRLYHAQNRGTVSGNLIIKMYESSKEIQIAAPNGRVLARIPQRKAGQFLTWNPDVLDSPVTPQDLVTVSTFSQAYGIPVRTTPREWLVRSVNMHRRHP